MHPSLVQPIYDAMRKAWAPSSAVTQTWGSRSPRQIDYARFLNHLTPPPTTTTTPTLRRHHPSAPFGTHRHPSCQQRAGSCLTVPGKAVKQSLAESVSCLSLVTRLARRWAPQQGPSSTPDRGAMTKSPLPSPQTPGEPLTALRSRKTEDIPGWLSEPTRFGQREDVVPDLWLVVGWMDGWDEFADDFMMTRTASTPLCARGVQSSRRKTENARRHRHAIQGLQPHHFLIPSKMSSPHQTGAKLSARHHPPPRSPQNVLNRANIWADLCVAA